MMTHEGLKGHKSNDVSTNTGLIIGDLGLRQLSVTLLKKEPIRRERLVVLGCDSLHFPCWFPG